MNYDAYDANASKVWNGHPIGNNLQESPRFMQWWDSLTPADRKALEDNIDARNKVLEEWKLRCQDLPSQTQPTQQSAVQLLKRSAFGPTNGAEESPAPHGGKSK